MKELHFERVGKRLLVATEGPYRFQLHQPKGGGAWRAEIWQREGKRRAPWLAAHFLSRALAIDWLARYRKPETEDVK